MQRTEIDAAVATLTRQGRPISVRAVHALTGGSFRDVSRLLKAHLQAAVPPSAPPRPGTLPPAVRAAVMALCAAVRDDGWTYRHYLAAAKRVQGSTHGLLTDIIEAMRAGDDSESDGT
jgi:hypothetical protein